MNEIAVWVVYDSPRDFPGKYVARKWVGDKPTPIYVASSTLDPIHKFLDERGLVHLSPMPGDDPVILETWL